MQERNAAKNEKHKRNTLKQKEEKALRTTSKKLKGIELGVTGARYVKSTR